MSSKFAGSDGEQVQFAEDFEELADWFSTLIIRFANFELTKERVLQIWKLHPTFFFFFFFFFFFQYWVFFRSVHEKLTSVVVVGLQKSEVSEFEVGSFFSSSSLTDFRLWSSGLQISSYFGLLVITRFLCCYHLCVLCFFFFFINFFKPPFRFVHFSEFTKHLIFVFWDCCSHFLCFCVCWFVTTFVIYFVCLCVCVWFCCSFCNFYVFFIFSQFLLQFLSIMIFFSYCNFYMSWFVWFFVANLMFVNFCLSFCCNFYVC
jgi:hypothetical protein